MLASVGRRAVHPNLSCLDQQLHPRPADLRNRLRQIRVQPHPCRRRIRHKAPHPVLNLRVLVQIEHRHHNLRLRLHPAHGPVLGPHRPPSRSLAQHVLRRHRPRPSHIIAPSARSNRKPTRLAVGRSAGEPVLRRRDPTVALQAFRTGGQHTEPYIRAGPLFIQCWFNQRCPPHLLCRPVSSLHPTRPRRSLQLPTDNWPLTSVLTATPPDSPPHSRTPPTARPLPPAPAPQPHSPSRSPLSQTASAQSPAPPGLR